MEIQLFIPGSIDGALEPWLDKLQAALLQSFPLPPGKDVVLLNHVPPPRVTIDFETKEPSIAPGTVPSDYHPVVVSSNKRITADDWYQDVRHLEFTSDEDIQYVR